MADTEKRGRFLSGWTLLGAILGFICGFGVKQVLPVFELWNTHEATPAPPPPSDEIPNAPAPDNTITTMPATPAPDNTVTGTSDTSGTEKTNGTNKTENETDGDEGDES